MAERTGTSVAYRNFVPPPGAGAQASPTRAKAKGCDLRERMRNGRRVWLLPRADEQKYGGGDEQVQRVLVVGAEWRRGGYSGGRCGRRSGADYADTNATAKVYQQFATWRSRIGIGTCSSPADRSSCGGARPPQTKQQVVSSSSHGEAEHGARRWKMYLAVGFSFPPLGA